MPARSGRAGVASLHGRLDPEKPEQERVMDASQLPNEAQGLPVQGPHRPPGRGPDPIPLRLILLPSGMIVDLTEAEVIVGRHSDADVRLPLPDVSRRHCRFVWCDGAW